MAYAGKKKHGAEYMKKAARAGREGASQEELGRLKDKYSKAEKKTKEEIAVEQGFEEMMGQFAESPQGQSDREMKRDNAASLSRGEVKAQRKSTRAKQRVANKKAAKSTPTLLPATLLTLKEAINSLMINLLKLNVAIGQHSLFGLL